MMARETGDMVQVRGLCKSFARGHEIVHVLRDVSLAMPRGQAVAVVGVSGAGKSTLLHILGALEQPTSGVVEVNGVDLAKLNSKSMADFRNKHLGFVFQFHHLLPEFTALENTMMPALINRKPRPDAEYMAREVLEGLGLSHRLEHKAGELSGGEQQRVAIARSVILEPSLLLADEPTGNLDRKTGDQVFEHLMRLNRDKGISMLVVTHNEDMASKMDRVVRISDGVIVDDRLR